MTATPIPRTLSLTAYGDLDTTALRELPAGRRPIKTWVVGEDERAGAYEFIREQLREGRQAYVVCPLVSESEKLPGQAPRRPRRSGSRRASSASFRVGVLHGQMQLGRQGGGDGARFAARRDRRAGGDDRDRGRDRRPQRDRDGGRGRRALRPLPAPPAARPGRARRARVRTACSSPKRPASWRGAGCEAIASERDGFKLAEVDLEPARRGRDPRHPPARPAALRRRRAARGHAAAARGPRRGAARCSTSTARSRRRRSARCMDEARRRFGDERAEPDRALDWSGARHRRRAPGPAACVAPRGWKVRPTTDRVREAIFSMLGDVERRPGPRPLLRHRRARDRGALARRRRGDPRRPRHPARPSATSSALAWATAPSWSAPMSAAGFAAGSEDEHEAAQLRSRPRRPPL